MGIHYPTRSEQLAAEARQRQALENENRQRVILASKIVLALSNRITTKIIRPGPDAEERECYEMAQELLDMSEDLTATVLAILKVHGNAY